MKLTEKVLLIVGILAVGVGGFFIFGKDNGSTAPDKNAGIPTVFIDGPVDPKNLKRSYGEEGGDFSFKYEDDMKATQSVVDGGEMITVEKGSDRGFQVFIMPFDEPGPVTKERILTDLPDADITGERMATLDGVDAFTFYGNDEDLGETFEVWAINKGKLYQITAPKGQEKWLISILETWEWK